MLFKGILSATVALLLLTTAAQAAAVNATSLVERLDHTWIIVAAALVLLMQIGFMLLEAGLVRSKNSINVAQKNLADLMICACSFGAVGFMFMFGTSYWSVGWEPRLLFFPGDTNQELAFFIFQIMFCGTAATIVSGAVAERFSFTAYLLMIPPIAIFIYPVFGHMAWGNLLDPDNPAFLADLGFVDFAGSTVVHALGGWIALAAVIAVGPRLGRFDSNGKPCSIQGHSMILSTTGALLLFVGWLGFNGGSTLSATTETGPIIANTVIAGAGGGAAGLILGRLGSPIFRPEHTINGLLGGLAAVTAGCYVVSGPGAAALGISGAIVANLGHRFLVSRKIDDAIGAISVHAFAGSFGTVLLAIIAPVEALPTGSRFEQLGVQSLGVVVCFVWAFGTSFVLLKLIARLVPLRVSPEHERIGLNAAEHGTTLGLGEVTKRLQSLLEGTPDLTQKIDFEPGDEAAELAELFNQLMDQLHAQAVAREHEAGQQQRRDQRLREREQERAEAMQLQHQQEQKVVNAIAAALDGIKNRQFDVQIDVSDIAGTLRTVAQGLNQLLSFTGGLVSEIGEHANTVAQAATDQSRSATLMRSTASEQDTEARNVTVRLESINDGLENSLAIAKVTSDAVARTGEMSQSGLDASSRAESAVRAMTEATREVTEVADNIAEIAQRTNLIAINASVEAARAGDHGRSFAIVASEISSLARATAEFSDKIGQVISEADAKVNTCVTAIGSVNGALVDISEGATEARTAMEKISTHLTHQTEDCLELTMSAKRIGEGVRSNLSQAEALDTMTSQLTADAGALRDLIDVGNLEIEQNKKVA